MALCGRYILAADRETIQDYFNLQEIPVDYRERYNIAPGQEVSVIVPQDSSLQMHLFRWGLVPSWAKDLSIGYKTINARAETIDRKPAFREAFNRRRCLVPADGYYEWKKEAKTKIPFRIYLPDCPVFAFAGIWESWFSPEGAAIKSFSIITVEANGFMKEIHDRMPVILAGEQEQNAWLGAGPHDDLMQLLRPYDGEMLADQVSIIVNSPRHDSPQCIARVN